jgi:hypothetical protein
MVEWVVADCCTCSKSAAKLRLQVEIGAGLKVRQKFSASRVFEWSPLFFAGNYQWQTIPTPHKCLIASGVVKERTAGQRLIRAGSSARWLK